MIETFLLLISADIQYKAMYCTTFAIELDRLGSVFNVRFDSRSERHVLGGEIICPGNVRGVHVRGGVLH